MSWLLGAEGGRKEGRKEAGADTALKTKNPHINVGNKPTYDA